MNSYSEVREIRITIHQPNYMPWLGYFSKVAQGDKHIFLDTVKYTKNNWINRNRIRNRYGSEFLTIPIPRHFHDARIMDVMLPDSNKWMKQHWKAINSNYRRARHFHSHQGFFRNLYKRDLNYLTEINEEIIFYLLQSFGIDVETAWASELDIDPSLQGTDLLVEIAKKVGATTYISGPSGKGYLNCKRFEREKIQVEFLKFNSTSYRQAFEGFLPRMSAIDLLLNLGEDARRYL